VKTKKRSLWPKEHGAYAQLAIPLLTALAAGRPTLASVAFVVAAASAFVAHEPAAVLLGIRGTRARREDGARARAWLAVSGGVAAVTGLAGLALARHALPFALAALMAASAAALLLYERKEKTRAGEIIAATALAGAAAPAGAASGLPTWAVLVCWAAWSAQFAVSTVAVHALVARGKPWPTVLVTALVVVVAALFGWPLALAVAPTCVVCAAVALSSLTAKSVRGIGYALAVALTLSAVFLAIGVRAAKLL
jgi:hypothetical protein